LDSYDLRHRIGGPVDLHGDVGDLGHERLEPMAVQLARVHVRSLAPGPLPSRLGQSRVGSPVVAPGYPVDAAGSAGAQPGAAALPRPDRRQRGRDRAHVAGAPLTAVFRPNRPTNRVDRLPGGSGFAPIPGLPLCCSSARTPSSTTCVRCSRTSTSVRAKNSETRSQTSSTWRHSRSMGPAPHARGESGGACWDRR
jgi:hypothetical protein